VQNTAIYLDKVEQDGLFIIVNRDKDVQDPREFHENLGTMVCYHRRYCIGDINHGHEDPFEFRKWVTSSDDVVAYFPIYLLDHSGLTMSVNSFNDRWDSGQIGYIYCTKEAVRNWFNIKRVTAKYVDKAKEILLEEVKEMDNYLRNFVYYVTFGTEEEDEESSLSNIITDDLRNVLRQELPPEYGPLINRLQDVY